MSELPGQSQAGQMSVRAGKVRSKLICESRVRIGREGNRDVCHCEVALRLHFPKCQSHMKARADEEDVRRSVLGCDPSKAVLKSCGCYLMGKVRAGYLRYLSMERAGGCSGCQSCVSALG